MKDLSAVFKALADESRLRILNIIMTSGEICVCDIEETMGFTQTKVSRHLGYLKKVGLVEDRKQGLWMLYSIAKPRNEYHKRILDCVRELLNSHNTARKDVARLEKNIRNGCCATFTTVKPGSVPVTLQLSTREPQ